MRIIKVLDGSNTLKLREASWESYWPSNKEVILEDMSKVQWGDIVKIKIIDLGKKVSLSELPWHKFWNAKNL